MSLQKNNQTVPIIFFLKNNGTVVRDSASGYTCACKNEFTGDACQLVKVIKSVIKKMYIDSGCCDGDCAVEF